MRPLSRRRFSEALVPLKRGVLIEVTYRGSEPIIEGSIVTEPVYYNESTRDVLRVFRYKQHIGTPKEPKQFIQGDKAILRSVIYDIRRLPVREEAVV